MDLPITIDAKAIEAIGRKYRAKTLSLFGSVLTDRFGPESDIDFVVEFDEPDVPTYIALMQMQAELADVVGRKVDLRTPNEISRYFRDEVMRTALVQYAA